MSGQNLEQNFEELDTRKIVEEAINEAFGDDDSLNVGKIENHCDQNIKKHYLKLADGDSVAQEKQDEMLQRFLNNE